MYFFYNDLHPLSCQSPFHIKLCISEPKLRPSKHNKNIGSTLLLFKCRKNTLILLDVFNTHLVSFLCTIPTVFCLKIPAKTKQPKQISNKNALLKRHKPGKKIYIDVYFTFNCQPLS